MISGGESEMLSVIYYYYCCLVVLVLLVLVPVLLVVQRLYKLDLQMVVSYTRI